MNFISVREEKAKELLEPILNRKISVVLDPTLLIPSYKWDEFIPKEKIIKEKYILTYVVEENLEYRKIIKELCKRTGLKVICFERKKYIDDDNVISNEYFRDPFEFVNLIKYAEYVVTTSFHATVFSIIFNKKFVVIPHIVTGNRVSNLLEMLRIKDRAVTTLNEFKNINIDKEDNYEEINKILEDERSKSIEFIKSSIEK